MILVILVGIVVGGLALVTLYVTVKDSNRARGLQTLAQRLGWTFDPAPDQERMLAVWLLTLFQVARPVELRNRLSGRRNGRVVAVFEYTVEFRSWGDSGGTAIQTVVTVQLPSAGVPAFALRPEDFGDRLVGPPDINLDNDPVFSRAYFLRGADEAAIRGIFAHDDVRAFYHRHSKVCTEVTDGALFFWRMSKRVGPEMIEALVDEALDIADRLSRHADLLPAAGEDASAARHS
jgi:carbonic anhydrase